MDLREEMMTLEAIDQKLESKKEPKRSYLGISYAGEKCDRKIWLAFRWAKEEKLSGRVHRLLNRGHREEPIIIRHLRSVGVDIRETGKNQREIVLSPWVKGHSDGIIYSGLKESPNNKHIAEFKTSNDKAFQELVKKGVREAKSVHYAQMQLYMLGTSIERAFYWSVNKNTDEVYTERVKLDREYARKAKERAVMLSTESNMPAPLSTLPSWYECKFCQFWGICHNHEGVEKNCRTCEHGVFNSDGTFTCNLDGRPLSKKMQEKACRDYKLHFDLAQLKTKV